MKKILAVILLAVSLVGARAQQRDTLIVQNLQFVLNSDSFIENDNYQNFTNRTLPYLAANANYVEYIKITAGASPEGTYEVNKALSDKRVAKVSTLIKEHSLRIPENRSLSVNWEEFYNIIYRSNEPYRKEVLKILSQAGPTKLRLIKHNDGRTWNDMSKKYFPQLRSAIVEIKFSYPKYYIDTLYITKTDTVYVRDTVYVNTGGAKWEWIPAAAIKTNLLADALPYTPFGVSFTPNVQVEIYTHLWGTSLEFEYLFPWWHNDNTHKYWQILSGTLGVRKYLNNEYYGHYLGIYGSTFAYDICKSADAGWQGEAFSAGLTYGYAFRTKVPKLKIEAFVRVGYVNSHLDRYYAPDPFEGKYYYSWNRRASDFIPRQYVLNYVGPTMVGVSLTYDIIWVRKFLQY